MNQQIHTYPSQEQTLKNFLDHYELQSLVLCPNSAQPGLKARKDRICRFCGSSNGSSSFINEAHLIPQMLGNRYLISDFECDNCNMLFSKFENDFANWLGISRSILGTVGKKGKPKFKSPDGINSNPNFLQGEQKVYNVLLNSNKNFINYDQKSSKTTIKYKKEPYLPINVYKILLKIALSILPEDEVEEYCNIIKTLINSKKESILTHFSQVIHCTAIPITENKDRLVCYLFKRKDSNENIPFQLFTIHYENIFISIPIPLHKGDIKNGLYNSEVNFRFPPPIFLFSPTQDQPIQTNISDLSSTEINRNDFGYIEFQTPSLQNNNLIYLNAKTGETGKANFKSEEIRGVLIVNENKKFTMEELQQLANEALKKREE